MKTHQAIIFDLDGTLIDSLIDISDAMNHTLSSFGYFTHPYEAYKYFVGKGLMNLVKSCVPPSALENPQTIRNCFEMFIDYYQRNLTNKTQLYPEINELLDTLTSKGIKMAILSNKADKLTKQICNDLLKEWQFEVIMGATDDFPRKPNPKSALFIAKKLDISPENILYVGDSNVDMQTAVAAEMFPVGVTWGFRTREELQDAGARLIIDKPIELVENISGFQS
ncbi:MAG: HAD family hydrolase [Dysgonamonadaceae bacterium]|jgi:phosphoglycolate phosphatase|nr:HAD family hydrolase [Dysgonamonadaceae bacterium]